jgi:hypothetical protein
MVRTFILVESRGWSGHCVIRGQRDKTAEQTTEITLGMERDWWQK